MFVLHRCVVIFVTFYIGFEKQFFKFSVFFYFFPKIWVVFYCLIMLKRVSITLIEWPLLKLCLIDSVDILCNESSLLEYWNSQPATFPSQISYIVHQWQFFISSSCIHSTFKIPFWLQLRWCTTNHQTLECFQYCSTCPLD